MGTQTHMNGNRRAFALLVVLAVSFAAARADKVVLNDGRVVEGVVTETGQYVYVNSPAGRERFDRAEVKQIVREQSGAATEPQATQESSVDVSAFPQAHRPEPLIFATMRQLERVPPGAESARLRETIEQLRAMDHDGAIRVGGAWINREEIARRREAFDEMRQEAEAILKTMKSRPSSPEDERENDRIKLQAQARLLTAAGVWPDPTIRSFLLGQLALDQANPGLAQRIFAECVRQSPLTPGFYQGRAMANERLDNPMDALADGMMAFRLKDDEAAAFFALQDYMQKVPGVRTRDPLYVQATELVAQYEPPDSRPREYANRGVRWVMPGGYWQGQPNSLPTPPVDYFVHYKAVAVPVSESGVMLVDAKVIENAAALVLEIGVGRYVQAAPARMSSRNVPADLPLAAIRAQWGVYTPVPLVDAPLVTDQELTIKTYSAPAELADAVPREVLALVAGESAEGAVKLDAGLLPGESAGAVFTADGKLVGFLAGRTDVRAEMGGPDEFMAGPPFADFVKAAQATRGSSYRGGSGRLARKADETPIAGQAFTLHVLVGVGGPARARR